MEGQGGVVSGVRVRVSLTELTEWRSEAAMRASRARGAAFECGEISDFGVYKSSTETRTPQHTSPHITSRLHHSFAPPPHHTIYHQPPTSNSQIKTYVCTSDSLILSHTSFLSILPLSLTSHILDDCETDIETGTELTDLNPSSNLFLSAFFT